MNGGVAKTRIVGPLVGVVTQLPGLVGIIVLAFLAGCAASTPSGPTSPGAGAAVDRDRLLSEVAACHLLRVGQTSDPYTTDATVIAAASKYGFSVEDVIARSDALVRGSASSFATLIRSSAASCNRLASLTGVRPALVSFKKPDEKQNVWIKLRGRITKGFVDRAIAELADRSAVGLIINSPGGSVFEARRLGRYLRSNGLRSAVDESCLSACVDVLAGGVERYITPNAVLGIHQSKAPRQLGSHESGQAYVAGSALYLREMGVDDIVALLAAAVPHEKIFLIPTANALETRLATRVIRRI
jgi:hypothetical protein